MRFLNTMKNYSALLLIVLLLVSREGFAQQNNDVVPAPPTAPKNLFEALPNLRWDPAAQGPLLMVAPQVMTPPKPEKQTVETGSLEAAQPLPVPAPPELVSGVYRTRDLLDYFGCRQVRLRSMTVFAPATMLVLHSKFGKPDLYARMGMQDKFRMLQATLTPEQWTQIGSPGGLGKENLQGEQREIFNAVLPDPFVYQITTIGTVLEETGEARRKSEPPVRKTLTPGQRNGIRLRMTRDTWLFLPSASAASPYNIGIIPRESPGGERLSVYENLPRNPRSAFGAVLSETVSSRLKPGQINFDAPALDVSVSLDEAVTVGDLVDRIRTATRIEIYADRRLARLPVAMLAVPRTQVRAGEVLKALCWGVTGAVRHVRAGDTAGDGVYILTDDIEGLGSRFSALTEWTQGASSAQYAMLSRLDRITRQRKAIDAIKFAPEDDFAPTAAQNALIEKAWSNSQTRFLGVTFPLTVLPADLQERARQSAAELNEERAKRSAGGQTRKVSEDSVNLSVQLGLRLEVPGVGAIPVGMLSSGLDSLLPEPEYTDPVKTPAKTISLPLSLKVGGVLSVTPADEEEARGAVQAARLHGLRQVWIAAPPSREDASAETNDPEFLRILSAAIQEGALEGANPVSVLAIVRVLTVPGQLEPQKKQNLPLDLNVSGLWQAAALRNRLEQARLSGENTRAYEKNANQGRDWLLPDAPGIVPRVTRRLSTLAATPGLSGVVLTDLLAPGYRSPKESSLSYDGNYTSLGYTPQRRAAAIRSLGYDPIDIVLDRGYISYDAPIPTFFDGAAQQIARQAAPSTPEQQKALSIAAQKGDLYAVADTSPLAAWNTLRSRATGDLIQQVYRSTAIETKQKGAPFAVYVQSVSGGDSGQWFGMWDQQDKLPQDLGYSDDDRNGSVRLERSAHSSSKTVLYRQLFVPSENPNDPQSTTDTPPLPPAEKFARDFNRQYERGDKSWDGYVFDLRDLPWNKAQEVLKAIVLPKSASR